MSIRILHVVGKMHYGGMETLIMNLYRHIDREKVQFDFLVHYQEKGDYDDEIRTLGGKIYVMPRTQIYNLKKYIRALHSFFRQHNEYAAVHGHLIRTAFLYHPIAKKYGIPVCITHAHNNKIEHNPKSCLGYLLAKLSIPYTDIFFSCSDEAGRFYFGRHFNQKKYFLIKNGIESADYRFNAEVRKAYRKRFGLDHSFVIGHIGRMAVQKNHKFLIRIFKSIYERCPNAKLVLIGDGSLKHIIVEQIQNEGLQNAVLVLGKRSDIPQLLQMIDVFVLPSLFEGLGIVLVEAQAAGVKSFASADVIPKLVQITPDLSFVSLKEVPEVWAEEILKYQNGYDHSDNVELVKESGFDIAATAKWLQDFYMQSNMGV